MKVKNRKYVDGVKNLPDEVQLDYDLTTEKVEAFGYAAGSHQTYKS
jgi:hypothetical protein